MKPEMLLVYVLTDRHMAGERSIVDVVDAALRGGATMVQLREKEGSDEEVLVMGRKLQQLTRRAGVPLIVNDRIGVALELDAEGVHVGQGDMSARDVRELIGAHRILGVSAETVEEALLAEEAGADYVGVGDVYGTSTKLDGTARIGLEGLAAVVQAVSIPVVAIGGITLENAAATMQAGAAGVAVISAIVGAADPEGATRLLRKHIEIFC
jgi:thiamine-phosphate pyrophosphorylase